MKQISQIVGTELRFQDGTSLEVRADCLSVKEVSDGHHSFKQLYRLRATLLAQWLRSADAEGLSAHKSRLMPDGLPPYGSPDYFALSLTPLDGESLTVVMHMEEWDKFIVPITATLLRRGDTDPDKLIELIRNYD